jgi:flagellar protein FliS
VNLYEQYAESNVMTASPMELVRMLYRFILENLGDARHCTMTGDIEGRGRAVSKATEGFLELITSLDHQQGGEVSRNLSELYGYMVSRVLDGHINQDSTPFDEVERLMYTLLDGWETVGTQQEPAAYVPVSASF